MSQEGFCVRCGKTKTVYLYVNNTYCYSCIWKMYNQCQTELKHLYAIIDRIEKKLNQMEQLNLFRRQA